MTVRDQLNLTYDVSFELVEHDRLNASWWCVTVSASPPKIADATQASLQVRLCNPYYICGTLRIPGKRIVTVCAACRCCATAAA